MTADNLLRIEVYKANAYLTALRRLARHFGGEVGRTILATLDDANDAIECFEKALTIKE